MKTYIRQRLRESLIENKKTTDTGGNRPAYGGRGDNVYYFNYGNLKDFKAHYNQIKREIFDKLSDADKIELFSQDSDLDYGRFRFKITINANGGPKIQGLESSAVGNTVDTKDSQTGNVRFFNKMAPLNATEVKFDAIEDYLEKIDRKASPHYYAYLNLLYSDYDNIVNFVDKSVGYLDDKAADIAKEKTPPELEYKRSKLGRHEKSDKFKKAFYGNKGPDIEQRQNELLNQLTWIKNAKINAGRERKMGYKEAIKSLESIEAKIQAELKELE